LSGTKLDLTQAEAVTAFTAACLKEWGRVDFLVCVAGGFAAGRTHETDEATWDRMFGLNLKTVFLSARAAIPAMIQQNFGRILINLTKGPERRALWPFCLRSGYRSFPRSR
jgi:NADP-dependent 3-hydroxy acid dehydrogenase YdfG